MQHLSGYAGDLNGSTQNLARNPLALKTNANIICWGQTRRNAAPPRFWPSKAKQVVLPREALSNQRNGGCCNDRLSWQPLPDI